MNELERHLRTHFSKMTDIEGSESFKTVIPETFNSAKLDSVSE